MAFLFAVALHVAATPAPIESGSRGAMRDARYCEIFVLKRGWTPQADIYNSLGLNDCPDAAWRRIDPRPLAKQLGATAVVKNGPRYFIMDSTSYVVPGRLASFGGIDMRLVGRIALPHGALLPRRTRSPYRETTIRRTTRWTYAAGKPMYELTAPDGRSYVMQSYARIVDPHMNAASLDALASRLRLPAGWTYRRVVPKASVTLATVDGTAHVLQDDFEDTYQRVTRAPS